jgi:hypothetical protein
MGKNKGFGGSSSESLIQPSTYTLLRLIQQITVQSGLQSEFTIRIEPKLQ